MGGFIGLFRAWLISSPIAGGPTVRFIMFSSLISTLWATWAHCKVHDVLKPNFISLGHMGPLLIEWIGVGIGASLSMKFFFPYFFS